MHVTLTDVLACPRCGPGWGLVLLPESVRERRALEGVLGCPNCRERYSIERGVAVLVPSDMEEGWRAPPAGPAGRAGAGDAAADGAEAGLVAERLGALLGLAGASGVVVLAGWPTSAGAALGERVEGVEVVVVGEGEAGAGGVSPIRSGPVLPFQSGRIRGVALAAGAAASWLEEGARILGPGSRMVIERGPADSSGRVEAAGLRVLAAEGEVLVAGR